MDGKNPAAGDVVTIANPHGFRPPRRRGDPNEQAKEAPYVSQNLKATKKAYGIDDAKVTE
ncbi:UPF0182 family protein, partial [Nocardia asteroides]|uniref:UPF0182 family protein n=1 Tax=Nocardia asteroides TaxID=1824 RepID=UPI00364B1D6D